jgi:hypothetical protein
LGIVSDKEYEFTCWIKCDENTNKGTIIEIGYFADLTGPPSKVIESGNPEPGTGWQQVLLPFRVTKDVKYITLALKLKCIGTVYFDDVKLTLKTEPGVNLAPNPGFELVNENQTVTGWYFADWINSSRITVNCSVTDEIARSGQYSVKVVANDNELNKSKSSLYDWYTWCYDYVAGFMNKFATEIKNHDNTRQLGSFLTYSFARLAEWEDFQGSNDLPDKVFKNSQVDFIGMQVMSAGGDWSRITSAIDLVRKHDKPVWAIDLIDFTTNVGLGYEITDKVNQAAVQHGCQGIYYVCWYGAPDMHYYTGMKNEDLASMIADAKNAMSLTKNKKIKSQVMLVNNYLPYGVIDVGGMKNDFRDLFGWYKILSRNQLWFDMYSMYELLDSTADDLLKYKLIVLPDSYYMPMKVRNLLDEYVKKGGSLLVSGRIPEYDETGKKIKTLDCLGNTTAINKDTGLLNSYGKGKIWWTCQDSGTFYLGKVIRQPHLGDMPPLYQEQPESAQNKVLGSKIFDLLNKFIVDCNIHPEVVIEQVNRSVEVVGHDNDKEKLLFFVHREIGTVSGLTTKILIDKKPGRVVVLSDYSEKPVTDYKYSNGSLVLSLPDFATTSIVRIFY